MPSKHRGFSMADMMTAIVLCVLVLFYANVMIGCGGGKDKDKDKDKDKQVKTPDGQTPDDVLASLESYVSSDRAKAHQLQSINYVRSIHMGMVLYAQGNKDFFPGLDSNGDIAKAPLEAASHTYGYATADGAHVAYRMAVLLRGNFIPPHYMISPAERNKGIKEVKTGESLVDGGSYSYAMLNIDKPATGRRGEWRATNNSSAVTISDRNIGSGNAGKTTQSLHTLPGWGWAGSVAYNSGHAQHETSDVLGFTEYDQKSAVITDHLFKDTDKTELGAADADAAMVFKADGKYVSQQP